MEEHLVLNKDSVKKVLDLLRKPNGNKKSNAKKFEDVVPVAWKKLGLKGNPSPVDLEKLLINLILKLYDVENAEDIEEKPKIAQKRDFSLLSFGLLDGYYHTEEKNGKKVNIPSEERYERYLNDGYFIEFRYSDEGSYQDIKIKDKNRNIIAKSAQPRPLNNLTKIAGECKDEIAKELLKLIKEEKYKQILGSKQRQCFMEDKFPILAENTKDAFSRTELELPEDKFLIAIVGNRLNEDLNIRFIALMETLLSEAPQIDFVVIGNISSVKEKLTETIFTDRVHYLGYQEQLVKVYPALDLYSNPERTGGGLSAVMALITGIPVVTLPNCDIAGNVGEEFVAADYDKMIETVIRYTSDQDFYNQKVAQAQLFKESNTNDNLVKYIQKLIDRVLALIAEEEKNAGI